MNKLKIILINILIIATIFLCIDYTAFYFNKKQYNLGMKYTDILSKKIAISDEQDMKNWNHEGTFSEIIEGNNNGKSIIVAGCSFIYGYGLKKHQTLPYKIAKLTNSTVYNLGIQSKAINTTYGGLLLGVYDDKIKTPPKTFIYNYGDFHIRRLVIPNVFWEPDEYLYKIKNNRLERKRPPFIISRFVVLSKIREKLYEYQLKKDIKYKEYLKKLLKLHFIETKNLLNNKYGDVKFIILVYQDSPIFEEIAEDLKKENFEIIRILEDFNIDTNEEKYQLPDGHPSEQAWNEIAPKLVKYL